MRPSTRPMPLLLFFGLATLLAPSSCEQPHTDQEEVLVGWRGETWDSTNSKEVSQPPSFQKSSALRRGEPWIETISWKPRAFVHHNFLTEAECDHLTFVGNQRVARSMVVDAKTGVSRTDDIRTSYGASFSRGEDPIIAQVEEKIAEWTHLPPENGEPMQVLRYVDGQKYDAHWDWFDDPVHHAEYLKDGNRYATVLLYLSEVVEGGETSLPLAEPIDWEQQQIPHPSECAAKRGIAVRPRKGDALLFFDMDIQGSAGDRAALHASCPTLKGMKWTATKWIHNKRFMGSYNAMDKAMVCADVLRDCDKQVQGEACDTQSNMTGPGGLCRKSCKDCVACLAGDIMCARRNMRGLRRTQRV